MAVRAVIFDWGGTLTPWHSIDHGRTLARGVRAALPGGARRRRWPRRSAPPRRSCGGCGEPSHQSATLDHVFERAGVTASDDFLASYFSAWDPHTFTDPDVPPLLRELRRRGVKVGVLSNTMWPRAAHKQWIFGPDGVLELIDGAVYTSEIPWVKPHPEAFRAAMRGLSDAIRVRVRGRPALRRRVRGEGRGDARRPCVPNSDVHRFERGRARCGDHPAGRTAGPTSTAGADTGGCPGHRGDPETCQIKPLANGGVRGSYLTGASWGFMNVGSLPVLRGMFLAFRLAPGEAQWAPIWPGIVRMRGRAVT